MAAKFDKDFLKKHHFWLLFIFVGIGLLLAWYGLFLDVPEATSQTQEKYNQRKTGLMGVQARPSSEVKKYTDQVDELERHRRGMWRQAWNEQKDLFFWPTKPKSDDNDPSLVMEPSRAFFMSEKDEGFSDKQLSVVANLKFGAPIPDKNAVLDYFFDKKVYEAAYKKLVDEVAPLQFGKEGWQKVLRLGLQGNQKATSEEIWLAMEDLWVQREILLRIHQVNAEAARFKIVPRRNADGSSIADDPKHRLFQSKIWELDLAIVTENNKHQLRGTLRNRTDRLQVLGIGNLLRLNATIGRKPLLDPLGIEGASVDAYGVLPPFTIDLPDGHPRDEINQIDQIFDTRTVPVKRLEVLALDKRALGDRNVNLPLRMAKFSEEAAAKDPASSSSSSSSSATSSEASASGLNEKTPYHFLERVRYIDVTKQVRRMPVGLVLVADQTYMRDIVESIANTKFRFQTTQVIWSRFKETIRYETSNTTGGPRGMGPAVVGMGMGAESGSAPESSRDDQFSANLMAIEIHGLISLYEKFDGPKEKDPPKAKEKEKEVVVPNPKDKVPDLINPKEKLPVDPKPKENIVPVPDPKLKGKVPETKKVEPVDPKLKDKQPVEPEPKKKDPVDPKATSEPILPKPRETEPNDPKTKK